MKCLVLRVLGVLPVRMADILRVLKVLAVWLEYSEYWEYEHYKTASISSTRSTNIRYTASKQSVSRIESRNTVILFPSVTDHLMQAVDRMTPPAPVGGPTQTSYPFSDPRPGARVLLRTRSLRWLPSHLREHAAKSLGNSGDNGRSNASEQVCFRCRLALSSLFLLVGPM